MKFQDLFDKNKISLAFSRSAKTYDHFAKLQKSLAMDLASKVLMLDIKPKKILDIGAGTGDLAILLSETYPDAEITGIDIAEGMVDLAKKKTNNPKIKFEVGDAEKLNYPSETFDLIVSSSTFQWVENLPKAFNEANRTLKENGTFVLCTFGPNTLIELNQAYKLKSNPNADYLHEYMGKPELQRLLNNVGFKVLDISSKELKQLYVNFLDMFRVIKGVGALNASTKHPRSFHGRKVMFDLIHYYEKTYRQDNSIYATYEVIEAVCRK